jgi:hypothetical protein
VTSRLFANGVQYGALALAIPWAIPPRLWCCVTHVPQQTWLPEHRRDDVGGTDTWQGSPAATCRTTDLSNSSTLTQSATIAVECTRRNSSNALCPILHT